MTIRLSYIDTSVLVPRYLESPESSVCKRVIAECTHDDAIPLALSELTKLEFVSTVAKYVRTRQIDKSVAREILVAFEYHCLHSFAFRPVLSSEYELAQQWLRQFRTPLRTMDALHLAVAHTNRLTLVTADRQLAVAAEVFGVPCRFVSCE